MVKALPKRSEVDKNLTWDLSSLIKNEEAFKETLNKVLSLAESIERDFKGKLKSADLINNCLDRMREFEMMASWVGSYAYLSVASDQKDMTSQERQAKIATLQSKILSNLNFVQAEILALDEEVVKSALEDSQDNKGYLENILRRKPHTLSPEVEKILLSLSSALEAPYRIYNTTKLADMNFGEFEVDGSKYPLSFVLFEGEWEYEKDTNLRREAFKAFSKKLREYQYGLATVYNTQVNKEKTFSELRGFDSVIDSLLFNQKVDRSLYNRQIDLIMEHLAPH